MDIRWERLWEKQKRPAEGKAQLVTRQSSMRPERREETEKLHQHGANISCKGGKDSLLELNTTKKYLLLCKKEHL